jgi:hypothetical protein
VVLGQSQRAQCLLSLKCVVAAVEEVRRLGLLVETADLVAYMRRSHLLLEN